MHDTLKKTITGFAAMAGAFVMAAAASVSFGATAEAAEWVYGSASWVIVNSDSSTFVVNVDVDEGDTQVSYGGAQPPIGDFPIDVTNGDGEELVITYDSTSDQMNFTTTISGQRGGSGPCEDLVCGGNGACTATGGLGFNCDTGGVLGCWAWPCYTGGGSGIGSVAGIDITWGEDY